MGKNEERKDTVEKEFIAFPDVAADFRIGRWKDPCYVPDCESKQDGWEDAA